MPLMLQDVSQFLEQYRNVILHFLTTGLRVETFSSDPGVTVHVQNLNCNRFAVCKSLHGSFLTLAWFKQSGNMSREINERPRQVPRLIVGFFYAIHTTIQRTKDSYLVYWKRKPTNQLNISTHITILSSVQSSENH